MTKKNIKNISSEPGSIGKIKDHIKDRAVPIVGIGASAGGLESFEEFFHNLDSGSGIAFILVSHLDPCHASMLSEILQRSTEMSVQEVKDKMVIEPDNVYIIPPGSDLAVFHGKLHLSEPEKIRGQRMPIDFFFRSLAKDQGGRSIGVILSGTGTDGTIGLRAILDAGGTTFVQDPANAKYDGMPSSAVRNNIASYVLDVNDIPRKLLNYANNQFKKKENMILTAENSTIYNTSEILEIIRSATSHDFSQYKQTTIGRRIERRMEAKNIESIDDYANYLKGNTLETQILFKELLINVTNFFRDPKSFDVLKKDIIPQLFLNKFKDYCFRIWVPACSTGEEAYSIAISLREYMDEIKQNFKIQIYGTDISEDSIITARSGIYPANIAVDVSPERLDQYFIKDAGTYKVKKEIREMITFAVQNVVNNPPFIKLDFISCRNLLIYLEPQLQKLLISIFSYALKPEGILFLGSAETIGSQTDLFAAISKKYKFFKAMPTFVSKHSELIGNFNFHSIPKEKKHEKIAIKTNKANLAELTEMELLKSYAPSSVVVDELGNILFVYGDTGKYLSPAPGPATLNIVEMAIKELRLKISSAIRNAVTQKKQIEHNYITVKTKSGTQVINLIVRPFTDVNNPHVLLLVSFQEIDKKEQEETPVVVKLSTKKKEAKYIEELEKELAFEKENLDSTSEESQVFTEELKSTNEELQSTNEELQSTNEELDTSREEMQSINEELISVNSELSAKIDQLSEIQNDLKNLIENINVGTIFLDENLNIKRYTKLATNLFHLIPTDIGRPLKDINPELIIGELINKARDSLVMFKIYEEELPASDGKWYLMRILPYRTIEEVVEGVVITFTEITLLKNIEISYRDSSVLSENIFNTIREPLLILDKDLRVISASRSFYEFFKVKPKETLGKLIYDLGNKQWNIPKLRELLETILPKKSTFSNYQVEHDFTSIGRRIMLLNARQIQRVAGKERIILLAIEDITERKKAENVFKKINK